MGGSTSATETTIEDVERQGPVDSQAHPDAPLNDGNMSELEEDSSPPTPRFIQDEGSWKRWKWVPIPVRRFLRATRKWAQGPPDARDYKIKPLFPTIQHAPLWLLDKLLPEPKYTLWRTWLAFFWLGLWLMTFALVMRKGLVSSEVQGWGEPGDIGCGTTYWVPGNQCGLDGNDCRPFNGSGFAFRCPASCASYQVLNPRAVVRIANCCLNISGG